MRYAGEFGHLFGRVEDFQGSVGLGKGQAGRLRLMNEAEAGRASRSASAWTFPFGSRAG